MKRSKKSFWNFTYLLFLLAAVIILFYWYAAQNDNRIERQNRTYATDTAKQTSNRIGDEFKNASNRISTYAYFLGEGLSSPEVKHQMLTDMSQNSLFDAFRFAAVDGAYLVSEDNITDVSDREYFQKGMQGETGIFATISSRVTNEAVVSFYSPVYYQGEILGVLLGVYSANEYLQHLLTTSYFGESAEVFLCLDDGTVIASSQGEGYNGNLLEEILASGLVEESMHQQLRDVFAKEGEQTFICKENDKTDNICVINLPGNEFVLVQAFPRSVTENMLANANRTGIFLEVMLIGSFVIYIIALMVRTRREKKLLARENQEMSYVIGGISTLFSRFVMIDLETNQYQYLAGTSPEREGLARSGEYEAFINYLCSFLPEEEHQKELAEHLARNTVISELGEDDMDVRYEYQVERNGQKEWEHMNVICLERKEGRASKILFIRQNITELKEKELRIQAKMALAKRKERQYRIAIVSNSICTYEFNLTKDWITNDILRIMPEGSKQSLLKVMELEVPCSASEWFKRCEQYVARESMEDYRRTLNIEYLKECFQQGNAEVNVEFWLTDSNEERYCIRQSFIMTPEDETGDIIVMVVTKDITEQVRQQKEQTLALKEALMQAQHANNAKTTFLSNMSHDIRTPMNAIIGFTTIAVSHIDNKDQVKDCLQKVLSSSNHLLSLINDILDMSRIESGKVQIKEQECNISEMMHNLVNIVQPQVKAKQLELFIDTFDVTNEDIIADSLKMNQVFVNLMSNAVKYTPAGGIISFRIMQKTTFRRGYGDYIFTLKDNGIGMEPEFVKHIFEPFEREASTTQSGIQGTGLGMAITKNIIDMMGGTITVHSEKGKGSEFIVELSLRLQDIEKNSEQIKELEGLRSLVVDDDFDTCDSVSRMLSQIGLRSEWTTSGREAVYRAKKAHDEGDSYHTYIIDWQMPETSGIETARRIRHAVGNEAPIIILTAYDWTDIEEEAKAAGITAFCAKPLFMSDLKVALLAANNLVEREEEIAEWTQADFEGKRVLLVEDNELNREIAQAILEETGFLVETAPDGTDAVDMMKRAEEYYYDVVLMDVQMPVMNGYEATREIRSLPREDVRNLPIIAMTANAMDEDKETALKSGMNAHLAKPISVDLFIATLGKFLK